MGELRGRGQKAPAVSKPWHGTGTARTGKQLALPRLRTVPRWCWGDSLGGPAFASELTLFQGKDFINAGKHKP